MSIRRVAVVSSTLVLALTGGAQAFDWNGFYAGIVAGHGDGLIIPDGYPEEEAPGLVGGVQVGFDMQQGVVVVGIQSELLISGMAWTNENPPDTIDWLGSTTARFGVALDRLLPYLKAGIAYGAGTGSNGGIDASAAGLGWTAGGGLEVALTDNISAFGEYSIYNVGPVTLDFGGPTIDASFSASVIKGGVNIGF